MKCGALFVVRKNNIGLVDVVVKLKELQLDLML